MDEIEEMIEEITDSSGTRLNIISNTERYLRYAREAGGEEGHTVYEKTTARELADMFDVDPDADPDDDDYYGKWLVGLAAAHGWDTPLYRADYARGSGEYSPEPISEVEAAEAYYRSCYHHYTLITTAEECRRQLSWMELHEPYSAEKLRDAAEEIGWVEPQTEAEIQELERLREAHAAARREAEAARIAAIEASDAQASAAFPEEWAAACAEVDGPTRREAKRLLRRRAEALASQAGDEGPSADAH